MSNNQDNLDAKSAASQQKKPIVVSKENVVEVAKTRSTKDLILWLLAIVAMISSTLVSHYLPRYWPPANDVWVQLAITAGLVIFALVCLAFTNQGKAFKTLLKDARIELQRVTWPGKDETVRYTWQVIVAMIIFGVIVWILDNIFTYIIGLII